ncbi:MAG: amidohydrolase [Gammaproteobacteria bacterium]|nr:amidohydrolase [Gammaproteobacteria bacterium]NNM00212.1 amidohydrolase [Gammaproteobacteria bacterium]
MLTSSYVDRFLLLLLPPALLFGSVAAAAERPLAAQIADDYAYLGPLFEHFHANPELSFVEHETSKRLAAELRAAGVEVTTGVGGTGVVGIVRNGDGPVLLLRADMDGLPVEEKSGLPYASAARQTDIDGNEFPVMHACGHDMHMTVLVGTARALMRMREAWRGTLVLIGQPAEERISGARRMLEDGLYERFPRPDHALALHVSSSLPSGQILMQPGLTFSSSDSLDIIVHGVGTHGASPHQGKDPIVIASQIVLALQTLVAREISPLRPGVVTVGAFHSGTKHNIISDRAELQLTVRSDDDETRAALLEGIERIATNIGRAAGLPEDKLPEVIRSTQSTPPTLNDPALTARLRTAFTNHFGAAQLTSKPREGMGAEDFAYFLRTEPRVPGVYFRVGGTSPEAFRVAAAGGPQVAGHHSPYFRIEPETSITTGVEAMTVAVLELLGR